jgi:hypothetical protein
VSEFVDNLKGELESTFKESFLHENNTKEKKNINAIFLMMLLLGLK